ncbi:MAG: M23 family metallopeptidase [Elusimicrobiota bacterium]
MPSASSHWKKELNRRLTVMVVPHGTARPRQLTFSVPFALFLVAVWTGLTGWAAYLASERLDYWRLKANSHLMSIKMSYFAHELGRTREMLDEVRQTDLQLRALIGMGSREAIIQSDGPAPQAQGGPTLQEEVELEAELEGRPADLSLQEFSRRMGIIRSETRGRLASAREILARIQEERISFRHTPNAWPLDGYVTSHFGGRLSPFSGVAEWHNGMDIAAPAGTPVRATADGTVHLAGWSGGYGKVVVLDHGTGYSTRYGHNRQILVKKGDRVKRGQIIALVGSTGHATGPHCHYEIWLNGRCVNPRPFMKRDI